MSISKDVFKHKHICLVEDHTNPLSIIRSLGEEGIEPIVLIFGKDFNYVPQSHYIKKGNLHKFATKEDALDFLLSHFSEESLKPFVYSGSDDVTLLLDSHYSKMKDKFYFMNGAGELEKYLQKYNIIKLAQECGLQIPKEELLDVGVLPTTLKYPVFTKAITSAAGGAWKDQAFICHNPEELKEAYSKMKVKQILVQEFIDKKNELCINGISIHEGQEVFMPYSCSYHRFVPGNYGNYVHFSPFENDELKNKITEIIRKTRYSGIFEVEFMIDKNDNLYFLEVNFRHSGWGYFFTYGGFNLPFRWAVSTLSKHLYLDGFKPKKGYDCMSEVAYIRECRNYWHFPLTKIIKDIYHTDCFLLWNRKDVKPFFVEFHLKYKRLIERLKRK